MSQSPPPKSANTTDTAGQPAPPPAKRAAGRPATKSAAEMPAAVPAPRQPAKKTATAANPKPPVRKAAAKKAAAKKPNGSPPLPAVPRKPTPGRKPVAKPTVQPAPVSAPAALAPVRRVEPVPTNPRVETVEVRRSWFSRRPLDVSRTDWALGWHERGRRLTRRRTALVVAPLLVAMAATAAFGARLLYADPTPVAVPPPDVTCWDGSTGLASACTLPSGVNGLAWVFPSFDRSDGSCTNRLRARPDHRRPTMWTCTELVRGWSVKVTYSELNSVASGMAHFRKQFPGTEKAAQPGRDGNTGRYVWRPAAPDHGAWRMATMYADFPYAVLIEAPRQGALDRADRYVVHARDPQRITVRTAESD